MGTHLVGVRPPSSYKVAWLANFVPPYALSLFSVLTDQFEHFRVYVSTKIEEDRQWPVQWDHLDVVVQRSLTLDKRWNHPHRFSERGYLHFPYDTFIQLSSYQPDIVISGELGGRTALALLYRFFFRRTRLLVRATLSEVTEQSRGLAREFLRERILSRVDAVLVNGSSGARYVRRFGVPQERIFLVPYTTEMQPFLRTSLRRPAAAARRLFFSGQLIERKGLLPFLRVLARWAQEHRKERLEFWLLGEGPQRAALASEALPDNVVLRFLGSVDYDGLPSFYAQGGIFVFPTLADEWGMVVNEALASGMPVLGSVYSQAVEELVRDGENGWVFRPDCPEEMYAALDRALTTPDEELDRMRAKGRESVKHLTPDFVADRILEAIRFVCRTDGFDKSRESSPGT